MISKLNELSIDSLHISNRVKDSTKYLVLDTNIVLLDADNIKTIGNPGDVIVLPETAVDEIDSKKEGHTEIAFESREFGRTMVKAAKTNIIRKDNAIIVEFDVDGTVLWIVSLNKYPDYSDVPTKVRNDRRIIEIGIVLQGFGHDVKFVTNDVMCNVRAWTFGLDAVDHRLVDKIDYEFTKKLVVPSAVFKTLHNSKILEVDPAYKLENYNYMISSPDSAQVKLATISNGIIAVLGKDTETALRRQELNPLNAGQLFMAKAIQDPSIDLIVVDSKAGTGKTASAISNAMKLIKGNNPYNSILYIRASVNDVPAEEEVGFLKGDLTDKTSIYLEPLDSILHDMAFNRLEKRKLKGKDLDEKITEMVIKFKEDYSITGRTALGMRGTNIPEGTIIIVDEGQNQSDKSLQKVLTRPKKNCKVIITGSNLQIDNPYLTKYTNGLSTVLNDCATNPDAIINRHVITLPKVVRSDFAEYAEKLFSKES